MVSARRTLRTMCPMNCYPTLCGMLVEVGDGRLIGVKGDPENPDSQGFLCTGLNRLTSGVPSIPDEAVDTFDFSAGHAAFDAMVMVEVERIG